ncbi:MAG: SGNH/GDSL hydrolase family protein [Verrucomicrobiota bacterium]|jgi:hypothetical protein|nr:SGNH/GDSL hydrolase family protein [Verrucomicrobiota bacterium]
MTKPKKLGRRCLFRLILLVFLIVFAVAIDAVVGSFYRHLTPQSGRDAVASLKGNESVKKTGNYVQHPYLYYTARPHQVAFNIQQTNSYGHRNPEVSVERSPGVVRIMAIGGSTTNSFPYISDPEKTWIAQAARKLEEEAGVRVEYINAGLHAGNSADLLAHWVFRNRFFKPDIVVLHMGGNDGIALQFPDYDPEYTHFTHGWRNTSLAARPFERVLLRSNLIKVFYAHWLADISLEAQLGRDVITIHSPADALRYVQENEPEGFERNLDFLVRNILEDGAIPVLFPFVYSHGAKLRSEPYGKYAEALQLSYEKDAVIIAGIAEKYHLETIDIPADAIQESDFVDFCHLKLGGETIKAEYVTRAVLPLVSVLGPGDDGVAVGQTMPEE